MLPPLRGEGKLHVQVRHVERVLADEVASGFDDVAHEFGEDVVGFVEFGDFHAKQRADVGIQRGFPELFGVHFAQPLVALHGDAFAGRGEDGFEKAHGAVDHRVGILAPQPCGPGIDFLQMGRFLVEAQHVRRADELGVDVPAFLDAAHFAAEGKAAILRDGAHPAALGFLGNHIEALADIGGGFLGALMV